MCARTAATAPPSPPGALDGLAPGDWLEGRGAGAGAKAAPIVVTGPRRDLLRGSGLAAEFAAPHGDMMLTGCYGLLRALRERELAKGATPSAHDDGLAARGNETAGVTDA